MGAMTTMAVAGGVGLLGSSFQTIKGINDSRRARRELEKYQRQELTSPFEGLQVSTLGADLQREERARLEAMQLEGLQGAGVRGLVGGLGRMDAQSQLMNQEIGAGLDQQRMNIDMALAGDRANIRSMQELREMQDIMALSSQYNAGQQQLMAGLSGLGQTGKSLAPFMGGLSGGKLNANDPLLSEE